MINQMIEVNQVDADLWYEETYQDIKSGWYLKVPGNMFGPFNTPHYWERNWYAQFLIADSPLKNKLNIKGVMD